MHGAVSQGTLYRDGNSGGIALLAHLVPFEICYDLHTGLGEQRD
jgi:hypothetical protein